VKNIPATLAAIGLFSLAATSQAAVFHFTGNIEYHNDVVVVPFSLLSDASDVKVYTDSFQNALNFDPITTLWRSNGDNTATLIDWNDDDPSINPAVQTYADSGFELASLEAGDYFFTIATYSNFAFESTLDLADPGSVFNYYGEAPIPLATWCQPSNWCGMGSEWSVWLEGVDNATDPGPGNDVPEPAVLALLGIGLVGLAVRRRSGCRKI